MRVTGPRQAARLRHMVATVEFWREDLRGTQAFAEAWEFEQALRKAADQLGDEGPRDMCAEAPRERHQQVALALEAAAMRTQLDQMHKHISELEARNDAQTRELGELRAAGYPARPVYLKRRKRR